MHDFSPKSREHLFHKPFALRKEIFECARHKHSNCLPVFTLRK